MNTPGPVGRGAEDGSSSSSRLRVRHFVLLLLLLPLLPSGCTRGPPGNAGVHPGDGREQSEGPLTRAGRDRGLSTPWYPLGDFGPGNPVFSVRTALVGVRGWGGGRLRRYPGLVNP